MKKIIVLLPLLLVFSSFYSQNSIDLTFTAIDGDNYTQLDSIIVMNLTQGFDTVLYYPDTVLSILVTGVNQHIINKSGFKLFQNYPNPVFENTTIKLKVPETGYVNLRITDVLGRSVIVSDQKLRKGTHTFKFIPGAEEIYFFTASFGKESSTIKILCSPSAKGRNALLEYLNQPNNNTTLKDVPQKRDLTFNYGDDLLLVGNYSSYQSGLTDSLHNSETYTFQFAFGVSCPGSPTVEYEGQVYNTVQIFSQCWLKENLNVGIMIPGYEDMSDNDLIEKFCFDNDTQYCNQYGGLYQWSEAMQYSTYPGTQGICPPGWHVPTDTEWRILEATVDSLYDIENEDWNTWGSRGYDAGRVLKSSYGWFEQGDGNGTDAFGFEGLAAGFLGEDETGNRIFGNRTYTGYWWSSSSSIIRDVWFYSSQISRHYAGNSGFSVRCIKD